MKRIVNASNSRSDERQQILDYIKQSGVDKKEAGNYLLGKYIAEYGDIEALNTLSSGSATLNLVDSDERTWVYQSNSGATYEVNATWMIQKLYDLLSSGYTMKSSISNLYKLTKQGEFEEMFR